MSSFFNDREFSTFDEDSIMAREPCRPRTKSEREREDKDFEEYRTRLSDRSITWAKRQVKRIREGKPHSIVDEGLLDEAEGILREDERKRLEENELVEFNRKDKDPEEDAPAPIKKPKSPSVKGFRRYMATWNNYTSNDYKHLKYFGNKFVGKSPPLSFLCFSKEICPTTGTPHLQMYMELSDDLQLPWTKVRSLMIDLCNESKVLKNWVWEDEDTGKDEHALMYMYFCPKAVRGTGKQNTDYCKGLVDKKNTIYNPTYVEYGSLKKQGARSDIADIREYCQKDDANGRGLVGQASSYQAFRMGLAILSFKPARSWYTYVHWIYGLSRVKKSFTAKSWFAEYDPELQNTYFKSGSPKWWHNYDGERFVVIDEFRGSDWSYNELLSLLGNDPYSVEAKGVHVSFKATHVIITSCESPKRAFRDIREPIKQLMNRIDRVHQFKERISEDGERFIDAKLEHSLPSSSEDGGLPLNEFYAKYPSMDPGKVRYRDNFTFKINR